MITYASFKRFCDQTHDDENTTPEAYILKLKFDIQTHLEALQAMESSIKKNCSPYVQSLILKQKKKAVRDVQKRIDDYIVEYCNNLQKEFYDKT